MKILGKIYTSVILILVMIMEIVLIWHYYRGTYTNTVIFWGPLLAYAGAAFAIKKNIAKNIAAVVLIAASIIGAVAFKPQYTCDAAFSYVKETYPDKTFTEEVNSIAMTNAQFFNQNMYVMYTTEGEMIRFTGPDDIAVWGKLDK